MIFGSNTYGGVTYGGNITLGFVATFNLRVLGRGGAGIQNVTVKLWDKDDNLIVDAVTDANGVLTEQILDGSVNPFTSRLSKAGYKPYEVLFDVDKNIEWIVGLLHSNVCVDQEVMLS